MQSRDAIIEHVSCVAGPVDEHWIAHMVLPSADVSVSIRVVWPQPGQDYLTLFTTGVSAKSMTTPADGKRYRHAELLIKLPANWRLPDKEFLSDEYHWPIAWLFKVGYYPHLHATWLGGPMTIFADKDPPPPIAPNTALSCMLLIADKSDWGRVNCGAGKEVFFFTLIPLYSEERDLEMREGLIHLAQLLEAHNISEVVDLNRVNVARARKKPWWRFW